MKQNFTTRLVTSALAVFAMALAVVMAHAQTSVSVISFQGAIALKPGAPALTAGPYAARFAIYNAAGGGVPLWQEDQSVIIADGIYRVELGSVSPLPASVFTGGNNLWLETTINLTRHGGPFAPGDVFAPRQHLTAVPYAVRASNLSQLNAGGSVVVSSGADFASNGLLQLFSNTGASRVSLMTLQDQGEVYAANSSGQLVAGLTSTLDEGALGLSGPGGATSAFMGSSNGEGSLLLHNASGSVAASLYPASGTHEGLLYLNNASGAYRVALFSGNDAGKLYLRDSLGNIRIILDASTGTKSFAQPDPSDSSQNIVYACPEGPEAAIYCRGTARLDDGATTVALPATFAAMASDKGLTVQVTPRSADSLGLAVVESAPAGFAVRELMHGNGSYDFDYTVMALRKGLEDFQVLRSREALEQSAQGGAADTKALEAKLKEREAMQREAEAAHRAAALTAGSSAK